METVIHPLDTVITRIQSADALQYKKAQGSVTRKLYMGLYQGFGPTVIASIPASIAFFTTYESCKSAFDKAQKAGHLQGIPQSVSYAASSAVAELVSCAIMNPAQVLKQNAQVVQSSHGRAKSPTAQVLRQFANRPSTLWTGYTMLAAGQLPCVSLTFWIYESLKSNWLANPNRQPNDILQQVQTSALCAAIAGCFSSWAFVPADVIKTRMRLAAGRRPANTHFSPSAITEAASTAHKPSRAAPKVFAFAAQIVRQEGISVLFRGSILTCVAAGAGSAIYLGSYEAIKLYFDALH